MTTDTTPTWASRLPRRPVPFVLGVLLALFLPRLIWRGFFVAGWVTSPTAGLRWYLLASWLSVAVLLLFVRYVEKLPVRTMLQGRVAWKYVLVAAAFFLVLRAAGPVPLLLGAWFWVRRPEGEGRLRWLVLFLLTAAIGTFAFGFLVDMFDLGKSSGGSGSDFINQLSVADKLFLVFTAVVTEEIRYRSYLIERLHGLGLSPALAALVSYVAFVISHIPFSGLEHVLRVTAIGAVGFPVLYYLTRNLPACILLHFFLNIS